ncbi:MAG: ABC transporter ATP-binding protein [Peptoniphilaceae bacterium]
MFLRENVHKIYGEDIVYNNSLTFYIPIIVIVFVIMYIIARINYNASITKIYAQSAEIRVNLAEKLKKLPLAYFSKKDIADLSATIMSDITTFEELFSYIAPQAYGSIVSVIIIFMMLLTYEYRLALSLFWVVPVVYITFKLSKKQNEEIFQESFELNRGVIDDFQEGLDLIQEIKAYNKEKDFIENINKKYDNEYRHKIKLELVVGSVINASSAIFKLGMVSVAIYGAYLYIGSKVDLFTYLSFLIISSVVFSPMILIFSNMTILTYVDSVVTRIREINNMPIQEGSSEFNPKTSDIIFENVNFSYEDDVNVLENVSFTAKQGEVTALVGHSGSGKTTAAKLASRFWDIQSGKITVGGIDISEIEPEVLLKEFSIVFQDVTLFNSTIMENIRLGRGEASDEEVKRVAKIARCDEFIEKLPEGYDTLIGENGTKLSGGERQRISIARALLKDAPIILLDESTASLDAENESKIQEGISELIKDKTVIIIAHRMRTVIDADNIVVLKDGKVVENGKSKDLLAKDGVFTGMYKAQLENN